MRGHVPQLQATSPHLDDDDQPRTADADELDSSTRSTFARSNEQLSASVGDEETRDHWTRDETRTRKTRRPEMRRGDEWGDEADPGDDDRRPTKRQYHIHAYANVHLSTSTSTTVTATPPLSVERSFATTATATPCHRA